jgi:hypothetical protein
MGKEQVKKRNILRFFILAHLSFMSCSIFGQGIQSVKISQESSIDSINLSLLSNQMPFCLKIDSIKHSDSVLEEVLYLQYIDKNKVIDIYSINSITKEFYQITEIKQKSFTYYRVLVCELLVGYDFFLIITENPYECFISEKYNYQDNIYGFIESSINFKKRYIEVNFLEENRNEKIYFKLCKEN